MKGKRLWRNTIVPPDSFPLIKPTLRIRPFVRSAPFREPFLRNIWPILYSALVPPPPVLQSGDCGQHGACWPLMAFPPSLSPSFLPSISFPFRRPQNFGQRLPLPSFRPPSHRPPSSLFPPQVNRRNSGSQPSLATIFRRRRRCNSDGIVLRNRT